MEEKEKRKTVIRRKLNDKYILIFSFHAKKYTINNVELFHASGDTPKFEESLGGGGCLSLAPQET